MIADVETAVARSTARRALIIGPILIGIFAIANGLDGAVASLVGMVIVTGYILFSGAMLSVAARISVSLYHAAALLGFFLRLGLIALTMLAVARLTDIDRFALGITVVVAYLGLFAWEAVAMTRGERELEWT
jgi:hypothetical protein